MDTINQAHNGSGHNIGNDYISISNNIFSGLTANNITRVSEDILLRINNRDLNVARNKIEVLEMIDELDSESKYVIQMLKASCDVFDGKVHNISHSELLKIIRDSKNEYLVDLAFSFLIKSDIQQNNHDIACDRYESGRVKGCYSNAIYYEKLCNENFLRSEYKEKRLVLSEVELSGILQGLFNYNANDLIPEVGEFIFSQFKTYNSRVLRAYAQALIINETILSKDYWCITQKKRNEILDLINEVIEIYHIQDKSDPRLFNIIIPLFSYTKFSDKRLHDICLSNIKVIKEKNIDVALILAPDEVDLPEDNFNFINKIRWCKKSQKYKDNIKYELMNKKLHSKDEFELFLQVVDDSELKEWVIKGGEVDDNTNSEGVSILKLIVETHKENSEESSKKLINLISEVNKGRFEYYYDSTLIIKIVGKLIERKNFNEAISLLEGYVGKYDNYWCSPIIDFICELYYNSYQFEKIIDIDKSISTDEKSPILLYIKSMIYLFHNDIEQSEIISEIGVKNYPDNLELKLTYLLIKKKTNNDEVINREISNLDFSLFNEPTSISIKYLNFLLDVNPLLAEEIIIKWFIQDPIKNSKLITQIHFNHVINIRNEKFTPSIETKECLCGVVYEDSGETFTKIIINKKGHIHTHLLDKDSPIAIHLLNMNEGEEKNLGLRKIKLIERISPFLAVIKIATLIRNNANDGRDNFYIRSVTNDLVGLKETIKQLMCHKADYSYIKKVINIPISIRSEQLIRNDTFRAYMQSLHSVDFLKYDLRDAGDIEGKFFITDIITVMYLCMTSLVDYFIDNDINLFLTDASVNVIDDWIDKIENDEFKILSEISDDNMTIIDSNSIREFWDGSYPNLRKIRAYIKVYKQAPKNLNEFYLPLTNELSALVVHDLYFMGNSDYPVFTVDTAMGNFLSINENIKIANAHSLIFEAVKHVAFEKRINGILYYSLGVIPYPVLLKDLTDLINSKFLEKKYLCSLLEKICGRIPSEFNGYAYLAQIYISFAYRMIKTTKLPLDIKDNPYGIGVDSVFYFCCKNAINLKVMGTAEEKLANFISAVCPLIYRNDLFTKYTFSLASDFCMGNFLSVEEVNNSIQKHMR